LDKVAALAFPLAASWALPEAAVMPDTFQTAYVSRIGFQSAPDNSVASDRKKRNLFWEASFA
jgi:hypothetical protein